jgi:hypothetical protein
MKIRLKVCETYQEGYDDGPVVRAITVIPATKNNQEMIKSYTNFVTQGREMSGVDAVEFSSHGFEYMVFDGLVEHIAYEDFEEADFDKLYGIDNDIYLIWENHEKCIVESTMEEIADKLKVLGFKKIDVYPQIRIAAYGHKTNYPLEGFSFLFNVVDDDGFDFVEFKDLDLPLVDTKLEV